MNTTAITIFIASTLRQALPGRLLERYAIDTEVEPLRESNTDSIEIVTMSSEEVLPGNHTYRMSITVKLVADVARTGDIASGEIPAGIEQDIQYISDALAALRLLKNANIEAGPAVLIQARTAPPTIGASELAYTAEWSVEAIVQF